MSFYPVGKVKKQTRSVVKGCSPEMISRTSTDHNLGGQPGQLAAGKPQGGFKHTPPQSEKANPNGAKETKSAYNLILLTLIFLKLAEV